MYVGVICGHMDLNNPRSFMSLLDGADNLENVSTNVPTNPHMPYPPPNYSYPSFKLTMSSDLGRLSQNVPHYPPYCYPHLHLITTQGQATPHPHRHQLD